VQSRVHQLSKALQADTLLHPSRPDCNHQVLHSAKDEIRQARCNTSTATTKAQALKHAALAPAAEVTARPNHAATPAAVAADCNAPLISAASASSCLPAKETGCTTADNHKQATPQQTTCNHALQTPAVFRATQETATAAPTVPLLLLLTCPNTHHHPCNACWAASAARHAHQLPLPPLPNSLTYILSCNCSSAPNRPPPNPPTSPCHLELPSNCTCSRVSQPAAAPTLHPSSIP
jgi:hypothetical protein